ncbi:MAG: hypothetical protein Q8Q30_01260 [Candidatus Woesebacteria bacterium]|nr:hypothetical protein [Candidatus Woesebacteria bacterium]
MERSCEKDCIIFKALQNRDSFQADINRATIITGREERGFDDLVRSMCEGCVAIKKIKNAIDEKLLNEY